MPDKTDSETKAAADKLAADKAAEIVAENAAAGSAEASEKATVQQDESTGVAFVRVCKGGETLMINPSTLAAHNAAGWKP